MATCDPLSVGGAALDSAVLATTFIAMTCLTWPCQVGEIIPFANQAVRNRTPPRTIRLIPLGDSHLLRVTTLPWKHLNLALLACVQVRDHRSRPEHLEVRAAVVAAQRLDLVDLCLRRSLGV